MPSLLSDTFARKSTVKTTGAQLPPELGNPPYPNCYLTKYEGALSTMIYIFQNVNCSSSNLEADKNYYTNRAGVAQVNYTPEELVITICFKPIQGYC